MKDFIYLKNLSTSHKVEGRAITFTAVFKLEFSDAGKGIESLYLPRLRKFMKKKVTPDLNRKTLEFTISKTVRCAEGDEWNEEYGVRLARVKVEIEACGIKAKILRELKSLLEQTAEQVGGQILDTEFRRDDEIRYYLDSTLELEDEK